METTDVDLQSLALTLYDIGAVQLGKFKLHSGQFSPIYLDLRLLVSYPDAWREVTAAYCAVLEALHFDLLAATPLAGLPLGAAICLTMDAPMIYPRKTAKSYGTGKSIEGKWTVGETVVVVDDLITSGDSLLQTIAALKASGLQVEDAVVLVNRQQGGAATLQAEGYRLHSVFSLSQLLGFLEHHERITAGQRDHVLRALNISH
jgi:uridine monophosphate synthetase